MQSDQLLSSLVECQELEKAIDIYQEENSILNRKLLKLSKNESDQQLVAGVESLQEKLALVSKDIFSIISRFPRGPSPISSIESSSAGSPEQFKPTITFIGTTHPAPTVNSYVSSVSEQQKVVHSRKTPDNRVRTYRNFTPNEDGSVTIPAKYGPVTIRSLGVIDYNDAAFHTDRYIYPVDYSITRKFLSTIDPSNDSADYECTIKKVDGNIQFSVRLLGTEEWFTGRSTSGAWSQILAKAYAIRSRQPTTAVCGPDLFGFTSPEIAKMIQEMPNANLCQKYKWQQFVLKESKRNTNNT